MVMVVKKNNLLFILVILILSAVLIWVNGIYPAQQKKNEEVTPVDDVQKVSNDVEPNGIVVVLDPGHGGEDPGAVSDYSGISEKNINLFISECVRDLLVKDGYTVIMTRTEDKLVYDSSASGETAMRRQDLLRRKNIMDESGADIVVSIHLNKFTSESVHGAQTFYVKDSQSSQDLAKALQQCLINIADNSNTREALLKKEDIIITKNCKTTTAIVECGFLSNKEEEAKLADSAYQQLLASAIKAGIDLYFFGTISV